ncbi:undecaprenyl-diphosphatase [Candidatus Saccharibacteria bacterium]|nr:MAG: undecaprenyl-diphosphatase [Candidatus Saccharibacteria bacterium]PID99228.1 MAG: undecaprenyl-diphosphatase [Candidatus Saccharibacteria bacterium]
MIELLQALLLGIVEGVTEFLPISSTGHLLVTQKLIDFQDSHELFAVVIQVGAIAAVVWYYRRDLWQKTLGLARKERGALNFWKILVLGTLPAGVIGLAFDSISSAISVPLVIALALIIGGIILWLVDNKPVHAQEDTVELETITWRQALSIGFGQTIAMIPGVSRSGATIVTGLAVKLNRPTATAFSFYLSIPVLVLASAYKLIKYSDDIHHISGGWTSISIGLAAAFFTALLAVSWLLRYITHHNFKPFALYRIFVGAILLCAIALGWV